MKCPVCEGKTGWREYFGEGTVLFEPCNYCNKKGKISILKYIEYWLWQHVFPVVVSEWLDSRRTKRALNSAKWREENGADE